MPGFSDPYNYSIAVKKVNRPRQQHYVTRAYIQEFAPKDEMHLYVYARGKTQPFRALPENIAKMRNYYSSKQPDGTYDDRIEHLLQKNIEDPGLTVIRRLCAGHYDLSRYARGRLAMLLAIQEYRVPWMREQTETLTTFMLRKFTSSMLDEPGMVEGVLEELNMSDKLPTLASMREAFRNGDVTVTATPVASLHAMAHVLEPLLDTYFKMRWDVLDTYSIPFVTSDCPVHRYYLPLRSDLPFEGLMDKRVQVRFPLSPSKMLVLRHDRRRLERVAALHSRGLHREASKEMSRSSEIRPVRVTKEEVQQINAHSMAMAARHVFSSCELPEAAAILQGECMNVRQVFTECPGGITEIKAHYPQATGFVTNEVCNRKG